MIIFTWGESQEDKPEWKDLGRRAWRWVFEVTWTSIEARREVKFLDKENEWCPVCEYFNLNVTRYFRLGSEHMYYDGPHCSFSLGFLHFNWSYWWCKKCMPEE